MNYEEFKLELEKIKILDKKIYDSLVKEHGKRTIDSLFERYINDSNITDDDNKYNRTSYYIECNEMDDIEQFDDEREQKLFEQMDDSVYTVGHFDDGDIHSSSKLASSFVKNKNNDSVRTYLIEIGKIPLLSLEEEQELANNLLKLKNRKSEENISEDELDKELIALGYDKNIDRKYESRRKQSRYLERILIQLNSKKDLLIQKKNSLIDQSEANALIEELEEKIKRINDLKRKLDIQRDYQYNFEKLTDSNLRLVVSIAKRYVGRGVPFLDLIQEGNTGLIKSIERFDATKGYKLSTYATWWIRQAVTRAIAEQSRTIRIPVHMTESINRVIRLERQLTQELGKEPTIKELAMRSGFTEEKIRDIMKYNQDPVSLSTPIGGEEDSLLGDFIPDESSSIEDVTYNKLLKAAFAEILPTLAPREEQVIRLRFGIDDGRIRTLEEIGKEFHVTRERIRQIEAKALRKLKHPSRSAKVKDFLK